MPVITRDKHKLLTDELRRRYEWLRTTIEGRDLSSPSEGAGRRSHWITPSDMCATSKGEIEIRLAVDDFKNILAEIKKLK